MRNMMIWAALISLTACGEKETPVEPDPPRPTKLTVSPNTVERTRFGGGIIISAEVTDQYGETMDSVPVTWLSTDTLVATVDDHGLVFVWMTGTADIVAGASNLADTASISANLVQRDALTAIYDSLDGPNWKESDNWGTRTELSTWSGVETDGAGNPTTLFLFYNDLAGRIPVNELLKLEHLRSLQLGFNFNITGTIPPELGDMKSLRRIYLHHNALTGTLPEELSKLDIDSLDVHQNQLSGPIPEWIGGETNLGILSIWGNDFTGGIPESIGDLKNLWVLMVTYNPELSGPLPLSLMDLGGSLQYFYWGEGTALCSPADVEFQEWLDNIPTHLAGPVCDS